VPSPEPAWALRAQRSLWVVFALNGLVLATWAARIPAVKEAAHLSVAQLGLVLLAPALGAIVAFELSGRAAAAYGSDTVTWTCAAAFCATLPAIAIGDSSTWTLSATLLAFGAGNGALDVAMNTHGVAVEAALGRPALSRMHASFSAGGLLGAVVGAGVAGHLGVGAHFAIVAAVTGSAALLAAPGLRPDARAQGETTGAGPPESHNAGAPARATVTIRGIRRIAPGPVLLLGTVGFACLLGEGAAADWSATYLKDATGSSAAVAALAYAGFSAAMLIGRTFGDRLRARAPSTRLLPVSAGAAAIGLVLGLLVGGPTAGILGFTAFGAGLAIIVPTLFAAAGNLPFMLTGLPAGRALARVNTLSYLGFLAGPPLVGALASLVGLRTALLLPVALTAVVALLSPSALTPRPERTGGTTTVESVRRLI